MSPISRFAPIGGLIQTRQDAARHYMGIQEHGNQLEAGLLSTHVMASSILRVWINPPIGANRLIELIALLILMPRPFPSSKQRIEAKDPPKNYRRRFQKKKTAR